jgi:hypothetical protein
MALTSRVGVVLSPLRRTEPAWIDIPAHRFPAAHTCARPRNHQHRGRLERGDTLINQTPRATTKPLARFKAYGVNHNRNTG